MGNQLHVLLCLFLYMCIKMLADKPLEIGGFSLHRCHSYWFVVLIYNRKLHIMNLRIKDAQRQQKGKDKNKMITVLNPCLFVCSNAF